LPYNARTVAWDGRSALENVRLFSATQPSVIVIAAALSRMSACDSDPETAREVNGALPGGLARLAVSYGARVVHVSTDLVFGAEPPQEERYTPEDVPAPLSIYGHSKVDGEERVRKADPEALVCRLPLLYGDSFGRGLGASDGLLAALERGETPVLFDDEWRTPLGVADAARALVELARGELAGTLHLAGPERLTRAELGRLILLSNGTGTGKVHRHFRTGTRAELGLDESRPADVSLDATLALAQLETPLRSVSETLA
jgi:dTDP-4-dehydrorhamnose reductase